MTRISELPRRVWTQGAVEAAEALTASLRTEYGTKRLRPIQAKSLLEAWELGGLYCQARVGAGKTLIAGLLPVLWESKRPLILTPIVDDFKAALEEDRAHFDIPRHIRVESYALLGKPQHATRPDPHRPGEMILGALDSYQPDCIIADEARRLKHVTRAGVAIRVARWMHEHPTTKFAALDGSPTDESVLDIAHLLVWALRTGAPIPWDLEEQWRWAGILDVKVLDRGDPLTLAEDLPNDGSVQSVRAAFRDRLVHTPGVIVSVDTFNEVPLKITPVLLDPPEELEEPFATLRETWAAPDGWLMADARFEVYACARQLALGFFYRHDPWPPDEWWEQRKEYAKLTRTIILNFEDVDTAGQVDERALRGDFGESAQKIARDWFDIEPTFKIKRVPQWISTHALEAAEAWGAGGGIIWTEHRAFAKELSARSGWRYFGQDGLTDDGSPIRTATDRTVIASIKANGTGRNLQHWHRNLITSPSGKADVNEQKLGRTHREGQRRPVLAQYWIGSHEQYTALEKALQRAAYVQETTGQEQKLIASGLRLSPNEWYTTHAAWQKTQGTK